MTTAARVAWGMRPIQGARKSIVRRVTAAVTSSATCVRAPARRLTAVWDVPPPAGMAPKKAPPALARPVARSSRLGLSSGSSVRANARPAAIVSVKLMRAMPRAPGQSRPASERSGSTGDGRPAAIFPMASTPRASSPRRAIAAIPAATTTSGAGTLGRKCSNARSSAMVPTPTRSVGQEVSGMLRKRAARLRKKPVLGKWTPRSFGSWSNTMTSPIPALKPTSTGSEMKSATKPSRRSEATTRTPPTRRASAAAVLTRAAGSPSGATADSCAAVRMAIVVVVLTDSAREVPRSA